MLPNENTYTESLIAFRGIVTQDHIITWMGEIKQYCKRSNYSVSTTRNLNTCCLEILQNIRIHGVPDERTKVNIGLTDQGFEIQTRNLCTRFQQAALEERLALIESLSTEELHASYLEILAVDSDREGSAGLGLYEVAYRSNKKLSYNFEPEDSEHFMFQLKCLIATNTSASDPTAGPSMMPMKVEATSQLPKVVLDRKAATFLLEGRSIPNNAYSFYKPIISWVSDYVNHPNPVTVFQCKMEYFNSSSHKKIVDIFRLFGSIPLTGNEVRFEWHYDADDDELQQIGQIMAQMLKLEFHYVAHTE